MRRNANLRLLSEGALGCIVELYQFHCTNESLSLRFLSRQRTLSLYGPADQAVYGESVGADIGSD